MSTVDDVTITREYYLKLVRASRELEALEAAGVDNWEHYSSIDWDSIDDTMAGVEAVLPDGR
jgi:hypothetical protein